MKAGSGKAWLIYAACGLLTGLSLAVILTNWRDRSVRQQSSSGLGAATARDLLAVDFRTERGERLRLGAVPADYLVLYLFTPQDCAACLPELSELSQFGRRQRDIRVFGIMGFSNSDEALQTRANFGLGFPILQDPEGKVLAAIAPPKTPWKVVLALPRGDVVLEEPSAADPTKAQAFLQRLKALGRR